MVGEHPVVVHGSIRHSSIPGRIDIDRHDAFDDRQQPLVAGQHIQAVHRVLPKAIGTGGPSGSSQDGLISLRPRVGKHSISSHQERHGIATGNRPWNEPLHSVEPVVERVVDRVVHLPRSRIVSQGHSATVEDKHSSIKTGCISPERLRDVQFT